MAVSPNTSAARRVTSVALTIAVSLAGVAEVVAGAGVLGCEAAGCDGTGACCTTGALSGADGVVVAGDAFDAGRLECRQPAARTAIAVIGTMNFFVTATLPISNAASGPSFNESGRRIAPSRRECSQPFTLDSGYRIDK
jgi:hypothetical protein